MIRTRCTKCGEAKPAAAIYTRGRRVDGSRAPDSRCKECTKRRVREWVAMLKPPRNDNTERELPPREDVHAIRGHFRPAMWDRREPAMLMRRNGVILDLLFNCGLRSSEALGLDLADLRSKEKGSGVAAWRPGERNLTHIRIRDGKGGKRRMVPLMPEARRSLENWVTIHRKVPAGSKGPEAVFLGKYGVRLKPDGYRQALRKAAKATGFDPLGGKAHMGRRWCITSLTMGGAKPSAIRKVTGHESIAAMEPYIRFADDFTLDEFLEHAKPLTHRPPGRKKRTA